MTASIWNPISTVTGISESVNSIAELRQITATLATVLGLTAVIVKGYYSAGDGGGGTYYLDTTDTTSADNGGTIIVANDSRRWKLTTQGIISCRQFGCHGDGTTDDTIKLQIWLNYCYSNNIPLFLAPGNYGASSLSLTFNGTNLNSSFVMYGAGRYASRITQLSGTSPLLLLTSTNPATTYAEPNIYLGDFGLYGSGKTADGLALKGIANFNIERLLITAFDHCLYLGSALVGAVKSCDIRDGNIGIFTTKLGTAYCNAITFDQCKVKNHTTRGWDLGYCKLIKITNNCDTEGCGTIANTTTGGLIIRNTVDDETGYGKIIIADSWFESNKGRTIDVENTSGLFLELRNLLLANSESGRALNVQGCDTIVLNMLEAASPGDTVTIANTTNSISDGCLINTTVDSAINRYVKARIDSGTGIVFNITSAAGSIDLNGDVSINTAGKGLKVKSGANARIGTAVLVAGTITVNNTSITANTRILLTCLTPGGTPGFLRVSAVVNGTSFTILSSNAADTSTVSWYLIESM